MPPTQRIPLRTLSEHGWNGPQSYQSGNSAAAPSIGKPSGSGSPISSQINSFLVASDVAEPTFQVAGTVAGQTGNVAVTSAFPNIPVTQNSSTAIQYANSPSNQTFNFTAPVNTLLEYYGTCCLGGPPINAATGAPVILIVTPYLNCYATDTSGIQYNFTLEGATEGKSRLPNGVAFKSFNYTVGIMYYSPAAIGAIITISVKIFGFLLLTYPSANPS